MVIHWIRNPFGRTYSVAALPQMKLVAQAAIARKIADRVQTICPMAPRLPTLLSVRLASLTDENESSIESLVHDFIGCWKGGGVTFRGHTAAGKLPDVEKAYGSAGKAVALAEAVSYDPLRVAPEESSDELESQGGEGNVTECAAIVAQRMMRCVASKIQTMTLNTFSEEDAVVTFDRFTNMVLTNPDGECLREARDLIVSVESTQESKLTEEFVTACNALANVAYQTNDLAGAREWATQGLMAPMILLSSSFETDLVEAARISGAIAMSFGQSFANAVATAGDFLGRVCSRLQKWKVATPVLVRCAALRIGVLLQKPDLLGSDAWNKLLGAMTSAAASQLRNSILFDNRLTASNILKFFVLRTVELGVFANEVLVDSSLRVATFHDTVLELKSLGAWKIMEKSVYDLSRAEGVRVSSNRYTWTVEDAETIRRYIADSGGSQRDEARHFVPIVEARHEVPIVEVRHEVPLSHDNPYAAWSHLFTEDEIRRAVALQFAELPSTFGRPNRL